MGAGPIPVAAPVETKLPQAAQASEPNIRQTHKSSAHTVIRFIPPNGPLIDF
jgi:hypothetical protein